MVDDGGGNSGDKGTGMVMVVRRKGTTWQRLNQHYLIWEVVGHSASIGNMLALFHSFGNAIMVHSARVLGY